MVFVAVVPGLRGAEGRGEPVGRAHESGFAQDGVGALLVTRCYLAGGYGGGTRVPRRRISRECAVTCWRSEGVVM